MRKIVLISGMLLSIFVSFFLVIIFVAVNPDRLKPLIKVQFEKYSNCEINIDEHLTFSFFPYFSVRVKHIQIVGPKQSPTINIDINNAVAQLKLIPFLHGKIAMGNIQIDELSITQRTPLLSMKFNNVRLKLSATEESNHSFTTMLSFNFAENNFPHAGKVVISGNAMIDLPQQTVSWKNIHVRLYDLSLNGELNAKNIVDNPDVSGHFTLESPNLKNTLQQINLLGIATENIPDIVGVNADFDFLVNQTSFSLHSKLLIKNIQTSKIKIEDIDASLNFKNNRVNLESSNAYLYGGFVSAEASINLNNYRPLLTAHVKALNMQIEPLFKLLQAAHTNIYPDTKMSGSGNLALEVSTSGTEAKRLLTNLNGTAELSISNGLLMGKDWDDIVAKLIPSHQGNANEAVSQNFRVFRFKQLTGSFKINNGVFFSDDLLINSSDISIKGKGQINFPNNFIDYQLQAEHQNVVTAIPLKSTLS